MNTWNKFPTRDAMIARLVALGFREDEDGRWSRYSWDAQIKQFKNGRWAYRCF